MPSNASYGARQRRETAGARAQSEWPMQVDALVRVLAEYGALS
jgi:hypothetical protein